MFIEIAGSKKNRKQQFLEQMEKVIPWGILLSTCNEYWKESKIGRKKYKLELLLKVYFLQQWYNLGDPTVEAEIYDSIAFRRFLGINDLGEGIPDETSILRFRRFLEENNLQEKLFQETVSQLEEQGHILKRGTIVDATIVKASSSTKNKDKKRDKEMSSTKKNNNYHFGMKAHIGVDMEKGLIHSVGATTAKGHDISMMEECLHGEEEVISGDKAYAKQERKKEMRKEGKKYFITEKATRKKPLSSKQKKRNKKIASIRAKVEHPFHIIKNLWKQRSVRYKGLAKNNGQWNVLAMLSNFYMLATAKRFSSD